MNSKSENKFFIAIERCLKKNGRSFTRQRRIVIDEILRSGPHFDIESLAEKIRSGNPSIGHATVYRTVKLLAGHGLIKKRMLGETHSHYEIVRHDHGHFVCSSCGRIIELGCPTLDDFLAAASKKHKFKVHRHSVELFGMCKDCCRNNREANPA